MTSILRVTPWQAATLPTESLLLEIMTQQGLDPYRWSNRPHDSYSAHKHEFHKVIYVVSGSITLNFPILKKQVTLNMGDRLDLPPNVVHSAQVGVEGGVCLEGHR
jgi:mannose-6-phosphate isomerase-like protein (cupin superfamily)